LLVGDYPIGFLVYLNPFLEIKLSCSFLKESINLSIGYYAYSKEIEFILPSTDFTLNADKDLLEMLFSNFIINAIDAIELDEAERGAIELRYSCDHSHHIFEIYDSGIAIENTKDLFKAFKSTKIKGNGLGLVLSRQIAEAHNGSVYLLESQEKGFVIKIAR